MATIVKNAYFSYSGGHRDAVQVWNVSVASGSTSKAVVIYVQGNVNGFSRPATWFAKKHLLTFTGGKSATNEAGTVDDKMRRIALKRSKDKLMDGVTKSMLKGNKPMPVGSKVPKYGSTPAKANTFINCDKLTPDALKLAFATALLAGDGSHAFVDLPADAVIDLPEGSVTPIPKGASSGTTQVHLGYEKAAGSDSFLVYHLEGSAATATAATSI